MHQMVRAAFLLVLSAVLLLHSHATAQSPQSVADVQISSVSGCVDVYPITVNCTLATTLHIHTSTGFPSTVDWYWRPLYIRAEIDGQEYFSLSRVWLDPSDATNSTALVNVTSTTYWPHITGVLVSVRFIDYWDAIPGTGTVASSAPFAAFSFLFEGAPTLTAISGCDGSGQLTQNCVPDATTITLVGSGLRWYAGRGPWLTIGSQKSSSGAQVSVFNDTCMTVSLDWVYGVLLKPQHYAGVVLPFSLSSVVYSAVSGKSVTAYTTNALSISFVPLPPPNITSWYGRHTHNTHTHTHTHNMQHTTRGVCAWEVVACRLPTRLLESLALWCLAQVSGGVCREQRVTAGLHQLPSRAQLRVSVRLVLGQSVNLHNMHRPPHSLSEPRLAGASHRSPALRLRILSAVGVSVRRASERWRCSLSSHLHLCGLLHVSSDGL